MAQDLTARDAKLVQYLNEAYGKEKELEVALQAHAKMAASRASYKKRLQVHLKETKAQAKGLERRIKQLGGKASVPDLPGPDVAAQAASKVTAAGTKTLAAAKGAAHAVRGTSEAETLLKNAKSELWNEHEEIANYIAIETLAQAVGDKDTEKLAREYRREEERMAGFLVKLLPQLTKAVAKAEIPAGERRASTSPRTTRSRATSRSSGRGTSRRSSTRSSSRGTSASGARTGRGTAAA